MTIEEIVSWFQQNLLFLIQMIVLVVQIYLTYRIDRGRLKIEKYIGISEKASLTIEPTTREHCREVVVLSNAGIAPIDEIDAKIDLTVSRKKTADIVLRFDWECKTVLNPKEKATISLYEKLDPILEENGLITTRTEEFPSGETDIETGEHIMYEDIVRDLRKLFTVSISIEIKTKIYDMTRTINKKYRLDYDWLPEVYEEQPKDFQYEENFTIKATQLMGKWKD